MPEALGEVNGGPSGSSRSRTVSRKSDASVNGSLEEARSNDCEIRIKKLTEDQIANFTKKGRNESRTGGKKRARRDSDESEPEDVKPGPSKRVKNGQSPASKENIQKAGPSRKVKTEEEPKAGPSNRTKKAKTEESGRNKSVRKPEDTDQPRERRLCVHDGKGKEECCKQDVADVGLDESHSDIVLVQFQEAFGDLEADESEPLPLLQLEDYLVYRFGLQICNLFVVSFRQDLEKFCDMRIAIMDREDEQIHSKLVRWSSR